MPFGAIISLEQGANDLHRAYCPADATATPIISALVKSRMEFLVPALHPVCLERRPLNKSYDVRMSL